METVATSIGVGVEGAAPPAEGVLLTLSHDDPQTVGQVVTLTGDASGGSGSYEYQFRVRGPATDDAWVVLQELAQNPEITWNTSGYLGRNRLQVRIRNAGSLDALVNAGVTFYVNAPDAAEAVTLTVDQSGAQPSGTTITATASASGGSGPYEYEFRVRGPGELHGPPSGPGSGAAVRGVAVLPRGAGAVHGPGSGGVPGGVSGELQRGSAPFFLYF